MNNAGRIARSALAPRAVILGAAAFQFGLSLSEWMRLPEEYFSHHESLLELFLASTVLAASACLAAKRVTGNLLAAFLCGPLPLIQAFIFLDHARRAEGGLFSGEHIRRWAGELANLPANIWLMTALSFATLAFAIASTARGPQRP